MPTYLFATLHEAPALLDEQKSGGHVTVNDLYRKHQVFKMNKTVTNGYLASLNGGSVSDNDLTSRSFGGFNVTRLSHGPLFVDVLVSGVPRFTFLRHP